MISVRRTAELEVSAASGLVFVAPHLFVVADDELFVDAYSAETGERAARIAIAGRAPLAEGAEERKRQKPDLESLAVLPDGRLLALGSGSTDRRCTGYLLDVPASGLPARGEPCDLAPLYAGLRTRFPELNIEGAAVASGRLRLLQRGNGARAENAVIDLDLERVLRALDRDRALPADVVVDVRAVDLGSLEGVRLGFTDASPIDAHRIAFVAAAEDTDDPYLDGRCTGSVLGVLDAEARVAWMEPIEGSFKIEGIALDSGGSAWLVADPDDRAQRAPLLRATRPIG